MKIGIKLALCAALLSSLSFAGEQFAMSDSDRAMYAEMLENNPADIMVENGSELLEEYCGGDTGLAKFLKVSEDDLPAYITLHLKERETFYSKAHIIIKGESIKLDELINLVINHH